ncbi:hypothetical protein LWI29_024745 [Acer saccharum]|uniref:TF-B3 domain-containing protein n=1 Tax=Acer saccharum TaxID=4024 RepID=A0AA39W680_ACESA|nr:hypothetical protein LWI29_024745 [Acer saccharum]
MGILQETHYADLPVIDWSTGQVWHFRIYTRPYDIHRRPVFTSGWPQFVRARGLGEGDKVSFFENQDGDGGLPYTILVHRPLQRFSLSDELIIRDWDFNERASIALPDPAAPAPFYHFI